MLKVNFLSLSFTYIFVEKYIIIMFSDSMSKYSNNTTFVFLHHSHIFYAVWWKNNHGIVARIPVAIDVQIVSL